MNWVPSAGQNIIFKREYSSKYDRFAVAGKTLLKGFIVPITVGFIPRELSRHNWYVIHEGEQFNGTVHNTRTTSSPLVQGELEIPISIKVAWSLVEKLSLYITKVEEIK